VLHCDITCPTAHLTVATLSQAQGDLAFSIKVKDFVFMVNAKDFHAVLKDTSRPRPWTNIPVF